MTNQNSAMIAKHIKALKRIKGRQVEAGWFESARYPSGPDGKPGIPVAVIARLNDRGGIIDHPGGTKYITDAAVGGKNARMLGTRFVKNSFTGDHMVTAPHKITIPSRPFMQAAWRQFLADKSKIQARIARDLVSGKISPDAALGQMGLVLEGYIAKSIKNGNWEPNARSTVAAKGFDKPLINSSHMLQSLSSRVT